MFAYFIGGSQDLTKRAIPDSPMYELHFAVLSTPLLISQVRQPVERNIEREIYEMVWRDRDTAFYKFVRLDRS